MADQTPQQTDSPKCATAVLLDNSGSMCDEEMYITVKRIGLALDGLIRREYPDDWLCFIEVYTFAKLLKASEVAALMPKKFTLYDPVVRLKVDMTDKRVIRSQIPPQFTNIQHGLSLPGDCCPARTRRNGRSFSLPTVCPRRHFEGKDLYMLHPPDPQTKEATFREGQICRREGITINTILLQPWWVSSEDCAIRAEVVRIDQWPRLVHHQPRP